MKLEDPLCSSLSAILSSGDAVGEGREETAGLLCQRMEARFGCSPVAKLAVGSCRKWDKSVFGQPGAIKSRFFKASEKARLPSQWSRVAASC